jgi:hypothetical protein
MYRRALWLEWSERDVGCFLYIWRLLVVDDSAMKGKGGLSVGSYGKRESPGQWHFKRGRRASAMDTLRCEGS